MTEKETKLLRRLLLAKGQVVSSADLIRAVWGLVNMTDSFHTLHTHVYRLRNKLTVVAGDEVALQTAVGGYRLAPRE